MTPSYSPYGVVKMTKRMVIMARILIIILKKNSTMTNLLRFADIIDPEILTKRLMAICLQSLAPIRRMIATKQILRRAFSPEHNTIYLEPSAKLLKI